MFPSEQQHAADGHTPDAGRAAHGAVPPGHPAHGAGPYADGAQPQFPAGGAAGGAAGAYGPFPGGAPPAFGAGGAPSAAAGAAGGGAGRTAGADENQVPQSDWSPAQWLEYILRRSNALEQSIEGIR